ncbi:8195_t:CDS:1, partial [Funneliformis caledonium]
WRYPTRKDKEKVKNLFVSYYCPYFYQKSVQFKTEPAELDLREFKNVEYIDIEKRNVTVLDITGLDRITRMMLDDLYDPRYNPRSRPYKVKGYTKELA